MARICKLKNTRGETLYTRNVTDAIVDTSIRGILTDSIKEIRKKIERIELSVGEGITEIGTEEIDSIINNSNQKD